MYLDAGGHITVPIPRSGPEAAQDVMSLSFTYKTFKHTGVLLSITTRVSLLLAFTVRDVVGPKRSGGKKCNNDYVDDSLMMGRLGYTTILSKNFPVCIFETSHASLTMGYVLYVLCQFNSDRSSIPKPSFRFIGMRAQVF